ncbi:hypothetical protein CLF_109905 [Clonorchis sinensis]|uniref:Uncharacterized protein n=1 Tax=Clonorchis sinensis TaxID=79923 RepID=G7YJX6_CLOSI|nr:hypothetical protein CLF_109905 [Clonorchis sinensis]
MAVNHGYAQVAGLNVLGWSWWCSTNDHSTKDRYSSGTTEMEITKRCDKLSTCGRQKKAIGLFDHNFLFHDALFPILRIRSNQFLKFGFDSISSLFIPDGRHCFHLRLRGQEAVTRLVKIRCTPSSIGTVCMSIETTWQEALEAKRISTRMVTQNKRVEKLTNTQSQYLDYLEPTYSYLRLTLIVEWVRTFGFKQIDRRKSPNSLFRWTGRRRVQTSFIRRYRILCSFLTIVPIHMFAALKVRKKTLKYPRYVRLSWTDQLLQVPFRCTAVMKLEEGTSTEMQPGRPSLDSSNLTTTDEYEQRIFRSAGPHLECTTELSLVHQMLRHTPVSHATLRRFLGEMHDGWIWCLSAEGFLMYGHLEALKQTISKETNSTDVNQPSFLAMSPVKRRETIGSPY